MYLKSLLILNYRSCNLLHLEIAKDEPNILIGINDCGKSTILKAINLLLSPKAVFNFEKEDKKKIDLSNTCIPNDVLKKKFDDLNLPHMVYHEKECIILGEFEIEADDLLEESVSKVSPHLLWVLENEESNTIWYGKVFGTEHLSIQEVLLTTDTVESGSSLRLYQEADTKIRIRVRELGISASEIENENNKGRFKKMELARAVYKQYALTKVWNEYDSKQDRFMFPESRYLDWNTSLDQINQFAADTISKKLHFQLTEVKNYASTVAMKAQDIVNQELKAFTDQFAADLPNINGFEANFHLDVQSKITDLLVNKANGDGRVHIDSQGEGIKRQIWFALIKWTALDSVSSEVKGKKYIWCFDEPETHLYPKAQREFFETIQGISKSNVQSIISTHSTVFIDRANFTNIFRIELAGGYTVYSKCRTVSDIFHSLQIKNSDFLFFDKFLVVEGITEKYLIPKLFELIYSKTLSSYGVQIVCLGGKDKRSQNKQILEGLLHDFNKESDSLVYLFDNDVNFDGSLTNKELEGITKFCVGRQDIEDSFGANFWLRLASEEIPEAKITKQEVVELIESIPTSKAVQKNQKFDDCFKRLLKSKLDQDNFYLVSDRLHSKGESRVNVMLKHITTDDIHPEIKKAFAKLL